MKSLLLIFLFVISLTRLVYSSDIINNSKTLMCSSLYYITSAGFVDNYIAITGLTGIQKMFESVYVIQNNENNITMKEIDNIKSKFVNDLGKLYNENPREIYSMEMRCDAWRIIVEPIYYKYIDTGASENQIIKKIKLLPSMPDEPHKDHPRWSISKNFVDLGFKEWLKIGQVAPSE